MSTGPALEFDGTPPPPEKTYTFQDVLESLWDSDVYDLEQLQKAYDFATIHHEGQVRRSGIPYIQHCLAVTCILAELRLDTMTLVAGLLHDVIEDTTVSLADLRSEFGDQVADIVDGVTKIGEFEFQSPEEHHAENWRKMLLAIARDLRVILIKLADRLHNMRTLHYLRDEKRKRISRETLEIYAPLAHRFGIAAVRSELEDLALKNLEPEIYRDLVEKIAMKKEERQDFLGKLTEPLEAGLRKQRISAEIQGRAKHFYSIYNKMVSRKKSFEEINDLMAIRVVVPRERDCYETLGMIHSLWRPVPERIKDYIASPKTNHYRSLHTTVIGPDHVWVEFQIRTPDMHEEAEYGIAAHWAYKEGKTNLPDLIGSFPWLGELVKEQADQDAEEFLDLLKSDLFQSEVFVFTPKGDLKVLPKGSTSIDFAFLIHTEVGNRCVGARVNDRIVPLRYRLENGDTVEIITSPLGRPSQDWLHVVATAGARSKIRRWFRLSRVQHSISLGKEMLEREAKRSRVSLEKLDQEAAAKFGFDAPEKLYQTVGQGDMSAVHVIRKLFPETQETKEPTGIRRILTFTRRKEGGVRVQGVSNVMIRFSQCCQPLPGEPIIGIVTRGRGISVHRVDCPNTFPPAVESERRVAVDWDVAHDDQFRVHLSVEGENRMGLLADVSSAITNLDTNILSATMEGDGHRAIGKFVLEVQDLVHLRKVMKVVEKVRGVVQVIREDQNPDRTGPAEVLKLGGAARLVSRGDVLWFRAPALAFHTDVEHGVTHSSLGNFSMTQTKEPLRVEERRARLLEAADLADVAVFAPPLHHSANVGRVVGGEIVDTSPDPSRGRWDALISNEPGKVLAVTVADCVPVFFVDVEELAYGVAHAGWRGIYGGIVKRTVAAMIDEFDTKPANLLVGTGPAIRGPSYEVGPEVAGLFPEPFTVPVGDPGEGRAQVDLPSCALADAAGAGVPRDNLVDFAADTFRHPEDLFSHRRGDRARHWAFIGRSC